MYREYCVYNKVIDNYDKELSRVFKAMDKGIEGIATPVYLIKQIREFIPNTMTIAAPVDYPLGYSSTETRKQIAIHALKSGANALDYVPNHYFFKHRFVELKNEIKTIVRLCEEHSASFRIFLDYHRYSSLINTAKIFKEMGVEIVFPTIGYHHDDFTDNFINSKLIEKKTDLSVIFNGYVWNQKQFDQIKKSNLFGVRFYNSKFLG